MRSPPLTILRTGNIARDVERLLPPYSAGLPTVTQEPCIGESCSACVSACPTGAISIRDGGVFLDRGLCLGCSACLPVCPTGSLSPDHSTDTATLSREALVLSSAPGVVAEKRGRDVFRRSLHVREVSTGDGAGDAEVIASTNSVFDVARFGIHFVASPRFADALLVVGPVGRGMREPLRRCYGAMSEPRMVIACGVSAISGGLFRGGYAEADGVDSVLPVDCYIPGDPPHPWSIVQALLLLMGRL